MPTTTKTIGPLHFEDLDPHRFEDLIRQLAYDFRDWQSIEGVGRSGGDDGFDIRAFERGRVDRDPDEPDDEGSPPAEGPVWQFQCKREKTMGPARVSAVIEESVDRSNPPYGFVLAAPANFSKQAHDVFREQLRARGVTEFFLWGRTALEDMLLQPKNDHILFTFFGLSLVSRRRSRLTEIRSVIATKNKLMRVLGSSPQNQQVLLRDASDTHYPWSSDYADFAENPRWQQYAVVQIDPAGLVLEVEEHYAVFDERAGEWDATDAVNLASFAVEEDDQSPGAFTLRDRVEAVWDGFPHNQRAKLIKQGLIRFRSILAIDPEGDSSYSCPHLYVDFGGPNGPFMGFRRHLRRGPLSEVDPEKLRRVQRFPKEFEIARIGTVHRDRSIQVDTAQNARLRSEGKYGPVELHDVDGRYGYLQSRDVIDVEQDKADSRAEPIMAQVTGIWRRPAKDLLADPSAHSFDIQEIERAVGRTLTPDDEIVTYELKGFYRWQLDRD